MFLLINPRVRFAFQVILSMCEFQDKTPEMSIPKYLSLATTSRTSMQMIQIVNWVSGGCHPYHLALRGIKLHVPPGLPHRQGVKVILEHSATIRAIHSEIDRSVVCKKSYLGYQLFWQVIYIGKKQDRAQDRALWYT